MRYATRTRRGIWFEQGPPLDIYTEGLTRTDATAGIAMLTFTPLKALSDVVQIYLSDIDFNLLA